MAPKSEVPDLAVDDLKRRARRRLVGAVVIALAAAVILPMLLESDPKPLGGDVSIQIPPIDNGKFVTPLSPDKSPPGKSAAEAKSDSKAETKSETKAAAPASPALTTPPPAPPKRGLVEAEQRVLGQTSSKATSAPKADTKSSSVTEAKTDAAGMTTLPAATPASPDVTSAMVTEAPATKAADATATAKPPPAAATKAAVTGAFQVQIAAFSDAKLASELAKKATAAGFPAHTEEVPTQRGTVHRVRAGPYATRAAAESAVGKLKSIGLGNAQVVAAK